MLRVGKGIHLLGQHLLNGPKINDAWQEASSEASEQSPPKCLTWVDIPTQHRVAYCEARQGVENQGSQKFPPLFSGVMPKTKENLT